MNAARNQFSLTRGASKPAARQKTQFYQQRRLPLEFIDKVDDTTIFERAELLARRRGSASDR